MGTLGRVKGFIRERWPTTLCRVNALGHREVLRFDEKVLGKEHPDYAMDLKNLAFPMPHFLIKKFPLKQFQMQQFPIANYLTKREPKHLKG